MNPSTADTAEGPSDGSSMADPAPRSAAAARDKVGTLLQHIGIDLDSVTAADALLVTSELVTNAIRHGGGITAFRAEIADNVLCLSVSDMSPTVPAARTQSPEQPGGFGWPLIQHLTTSLDVREHPDGKTITAVLRLA
ncbi:ATP-binding protein [Streptomyces sp. NPDC057939]|uniref:ATP-binding protein n=1 Tax=Streptomyces sp. NPDC057939 TaxID=3346284 RepID=UPI0036EDEF55